MHSAAIAPIRGVREVLGALTLGCSERSEAFTDLSLLEDIARRTGLALENARLYQRQRHVTETMQRHLLPQLPDIAGLKMTARYLSAPQASEVGGDWYDAFFLKDGAVAVAIGDVVGHDIDAAAAMAQTRNMLRAYAWSYQEPPSLIVSRLDEAVQQMTDVSLATVVFARVEYDSEDQLPRRMRWANAGHPPPLLVTYDGQARFLDAPIDVPIGTGFAGPRQDAAIELPPLATVVFYTDGLIESRARSIDVGLERLRQHAAGSPTALSMPSATCCSTVSDQPTMTTTSRSSPCEGLPRRQKNNSQSGVNTRREVVRCFPFRERLTEWRGHTRNPPVASNIHGSMRPSLVLLFGTARRRDGRGVN